MTDRIDLPADNTAERLPSQRSPGDALDYLRAAWARRRVALIAALVLAGFGAAWSLLSPPRYEASVTLAVVPSKVGEPAVTTVPPEAVQGTNIANFAPIISSYAAVAPVVREFKLDQAPRNITPSGFLESVLTVKPLVDTNLVRVIVELDDPDLAAKVTNRLVDTSIALARSVTERGISSTLHDLKRVLDQAEARMIEAETRYDEYRRTAQIESLQKHVERSLEQRGVFKGIQDDRGRNHAAQTDADLAKGQRTPTVRDRSLRGTSAGASEIAPLDDLYNRESLLSRRELERTIARNSFQDAALRYQIAHLDAVGRTPQVVVVDAAVPPVTPVSRLLVRNIALGLLTGLLFGLLVAVGDTLLGRRLPNRPA